MQNQESIVIVEENFLLHVSIFLVSPQEPGQLSGITQYYGLDDQGFESQNGLRNFLFTTSSRPALGPTQPPIQWALGALSLGVKWLECEADHSPLSGAEVKNAWSYTSTPPIRLHGTGTLPYLIKWFSKFHLPFCF
jgi:hypothetical protein